MINKDNFMEISGRTLDALGCLPKESHPRSTFTPEGLAQSKINNGLFVNFDRERVFEAVMHRGFTYVVDAGIDYVRTPAGVALEGDLNVLESARLAFLEHNNLQNNNMESMPSLTRLPKKLRARMKGN